MGESLQDQFISDSYTSILHLSGIDLNTPPSTINGVYDGAGNPTGISLSGARVVVNNYVMPVGPSTPGEWLDAFYPIDSIKLTFDDSNPGDKIANTTWELVSQGRFLVGIGSGTDINELVATYTPGENNGEYSHTLTADELAAHSHEIEEKVVGADNPRPGVVQGGEFIGGREQQGGVQYSTLSAGEGKAHNNVPPSYGIYVWRRTG
tara:strand:+ start:1180 stop:1800 length:621 start_codon:yes stop_codon:yes gene_type:complete